MNEVAAVKVADFWTIQFSPACVEWMYVVTKLLNAVEVIVWNDYLTYTHEESGDLVYRLKKERYSASLLSKHLGIATERLEKMQVIHLDPPAQNKGLAKPTVEYWGTA